MFPRVSTCLAVAKCVKNSYDNELQAQFADVLGCWSVALGGGVIGVLEYELRICRLF